MTEPERAADLKTCSDSLCERKGQLLPLTEFYRDGSRHDGRESACKQCKTRKTREEWKAKKDPEVQRKPSVRVLLAIEKGFKTREQIGTATGLDEDLISNALAELYDANTVKIKRVYGEAEFHLAA